MHLDQRVVAGIPLRAQVEAYRSSPSVALVEEGADCNGRHIVARETAESVDAAAAAISGEKATELITGDLPADPSSAEFVCIYSEQFAVQEGGAEDPETGGTGAGGPVSKYTEAVALPKLSPHDAPRLPIAVRTL